MTNQTADFTAKLHELETEMNRVSLEFQAKEKLAEELRLAIETAKKTAKDKEMELEKVKQEKLAAEREAVRKQSEHIKAESELKALKLQNDNYHREYQTFHQTYERSMAEQKNSANHK